MSKYGVLSGPYFPVFGLITAVSIVVFQERHEVIILGDASIIYWKLISSQP